MILVFHILCALGGLTAATFAYLLPSSLKIKISAYLTVVTIASGVYLVISTHADMISACVSGLLYLGFVAALLSLASVKLSKEKSNAS